MMARYFRFTVFSAFCACFVLKAYAQSIECEQLPECTALGYEADVNCEGGAAISCPFNVAYKRCVNVTCSDLGYTQSGKEKWCKKVLTCPTDESYTLCAEGCGTYCPDGSSWDPDCQYGRTLAGTDGCGNKCYSCNSCLLDEQTGWNTAVASCTSNQYVISVLKSQCGIEGTRYICGECPANMKADPDNPYACICDEDSGYYNYCPEHMICEGMSSFFGSCQHVTGCEKGYKLVSNECVPTSCPSPSSTVSSLSNLTCTPTGDWQGEQPCYTCACDDTHCGEGCATELNDCADFLYSDDSHPQNGAPDKSSEKCTMYTKNANHTCNKGLDKYKEFKCNDGYVPSGGECVAACPTGMVNKTTLSNEDATNYYTCSQQSNGITCCSCVGKTCGSEFSATSAPANSTYNTCVSRSTQTSGQCSFGTTKYEITGCIDGYLPLADKSCCPETCTYRNQTDADPYCYNVTVNTVCERTCYVRGAEKACKDISSDYYNSESDASDGGTYTTGTATVCGKTCYTRIGAACTDTCSAHSWYDTQSDATNNGAYQYTEDSVCNGATKCYVRGSASPCATKDGNKYATSATGCGSAGAAGWHVDSTDTNGKSGILTCKKCVADNHCSTGTCNGENCDGIYKANASDCGGNGYALNSNFTNGYYGDNLCQLCYAQDCASKSGYAYATDAEKCSTNDGTGDFVGWELNTNYSNGSSAGKTCYRCKAKTCPSGSSTSYTETHHTCELTGYKGDTACKSCSCVTGDGYYDSNADCTAHYNTNYSSGASSCKSDGNGCYEVRCNPAEGAFAYTTTGKTACETANPGWNCALSNNCYRKSSCKPDYYGDNCTANTCYSANGTSYLSIYTGGIYSSQCSSVTKDASKYYTDYSVTTPSGSQLCCGAKACANGTYSTSSCNNDCKGSMVCTLGAGDSNCTYGCQTTCTYGTCDPSVYKYYSIANATMTGECTDVMPNCEAGNTHYSGFDCKSGYKKNSSNNGCISCSDLGYYSQKADCEYANTGFYCSTDSSTGCYVPAGCANGYTSSCPSGKYEVVSYTATVDGSTLTCRMCKDPCYQYPGYATTASKCGTSGTSGWDINTYRNQKTGLNDTTCYECMEKTCTYQYGNGASDTKSLAGFQYNTYNVYVGDTYTTCYMPKESCESGYTYTSTYSTTYSCFAPGAYWVCCRPNTNFTCETYQADSPYVSEPPTDVLYEMVSLTKGGTTKTCYDSSSTKSFSSYAAASSGIAYWEQSPLFCGSERSVVTSAPDMLCPVSGQTLTEAARTPDIGFHRVHGDCIATHGSKRYVGKLGSYKAYAQSKGAIYPGSGSGEQYLCCSRHKPNLESCVIDTSLLSSYAFGSYVEWGEGCNGIGLYGGCPLCVGLGFPDRGC